MTDDRTPAGQSLRQGALMAFQIVVVVVAVGLVALLAERRNVRFDLTPTKEFQLSEEAQQVVAGLEKPVRVTIFYNSQQQEDRRHAEDLLELFHNASPNFTSRMLDLDRNPRLANELGISTYNTGVIETEGDTISLKGTAQENIVSSLLQLTRKKSRTLCFSVGHGEHNPKDANERKGYSEVGKALEFESFTISTLDAIPPTGVPSECTIVVIAGPTKDMLPGEADEIAKFLRNRGRVLLMLDPQAPQSFTKLLADFGVRTTDDVVVEERNRFYGADSFMPRVPVFDRETFGESLDTAAVFALARTLSPGDETPPGIRVLLLAITGQDTWARTGGAPPSEEELQFRRDVDHLGPLPVGVMVSGSARVPDGAAKVEPLSGRMIAYGDSDFGSNLYLNILGNKDLFMSSIAVLAEDQELVAMRSKSDVARPLSPIYLTAEQARRIFWTSVIITPGTIALLGIVVVSLRRRRSTR